MRDHNELMRAYFDAMNAHDTERCLEFFHPDAVIDGRVSLNQRTTFTGRDSLVEWHQERFRRGFKVLDMKSIDYEDGRLLADIVMTLDDVAASRIKSVFAHWTIKLEGDLFREVRLDLSFSQTILGAVKSLLKGDDGAKLSGFQGRDSQ